MLMAKALNVDGKEVRDGRRTISEYQGFIGKKKLELSELMA